MDPNEQSLWHDTAEASTHPRLEGGQRADVVVVGAGITGLTTALLLASKGTDVVVVEALEVAAGVTGRTTAKVTSQHSLLYSQISAKHGDDVAGVYGMANQAALEQIASLVALGDIDCSFERRPAYTYTRDEAYVAKIEQEVEVCRRVGLPASFTTDSDLPYDILGAVRFEQQAQFQPVAYCQGLARMLIAAGGRVFTGSRVTDVTDGSPVAVTTEAGSVSADAVVLATHVPILDRGMFFTKVEPTASHGVAVTVGDAAALPHGMYITAESPSRSVRSFSDGSRSYLVVVGEGHRTGASGDEAEHERHLVDFAGQHWPGARLTHRWMAEDFTPQDSIPYIGKLSRSSGPLYVATGYQKWGLTNGTVAAMILSETVSGGTHPWAEVFDANRLTPRASAKEFIKHNVEAGVHMVTDRLHTRGPAEVEALQPGEGTVVRAGGKQYAVSKDDEGNVHTLSATCTHLGCLVKFNSADRSWDCPCHGSRFAADGSVFHGPAVQPLANEQLPQG